MKKFTALLFLLFTGFLFAQSPVGEIQLKEGGTVTMYDGSNAKKDLKFRGGVSSSSFGSFGFNEGAVFYINQAGEKESVAISNVDQVNHLDNLFIPVEIRKKRPRMMQVVAKNDKYVLTNLSSNGLDYFYISDHDGNLAEKQIIHTASKKKSAKAIAKVKEYFGDCTELIEGLELNFSKPSGRGFSARYYLMFHLEDDEAKNPLSNIDCTSE